MVGMGICCGDFAGDGRGDQFQNEGEGAGVGQGLGVGQEAVPLGAGFAFDVVAFFLKDALREHSQMAQERNAVRQNGAHLGEDGAAAFGLDRLRAGGERGGGRWRGPAAGDW